MVTRSIWKGFISIRDVKVPIKLFSEVNAKRIAFNLLHAGDNARLRQQMMCSHDNQPVSKEHQIKGYEVSPGRYVIVTDDTLRQFDPPNDRTIKIEEFVKASDIDPRYFKRHFRLGPDTERKVYNTLTAALSETGLIGICKWAMRRRPYLGALRAGRSGLELSAMQFADEVYGREELWLRPVEVNERELRIGTELIENMSGPFHPDQFRNEHRLNFGR
jgi:DNA end-binding protein Ku